MSARRRLGSKTAVPGRCFALSGEPTRHAPFESRINLPIPLLLVGDIARLAIVSVRLFRAVIGRDMSRTHLAEEGCTFVLLSYLPVYSLRDRRHYRVEGVRTSE